MEQVPSPALTASTSTFLPGNRGILSNKNAPSMPSWDSSFQFGNLAPDFYEKKIEEKIPRWKLCQNAGVFPDCIYIYIYIPITSDLERAMNNIISPSTSSVLSWTKLRQPDSFPSALCLISPKWTKTCIRIHVMAFPIASAPMARRHAPYFPSLVRCGWNASSQPPPREHVGHEGIRLMKAIHAKWDKLVFCQAKCHFFSQPACNVAWQYAKH